MQNSVHGRKRRNTLGVISLVISVIALVVSLTTAGFVLVSGSDSAVQTAEVNTDAGATDDENTDAENTDGENTDASSDGEQSQSTVEGEGDSGNWHIKILDTVEQGTNFQGDTVVMVSVEVTNISDENQPLTAVDVSAFQDGISLSSDNPDSKSALYKKWEEAVQTNTQSVQPGTTATIGNCYKLDNEDSALTLEAKDEHEGTTLVTATLSL